MSDKQINPKVKKNSAPVKKAAGATKPKQSVKTKSTITEILTAQFMRSLIFQHSFKSSLKFVHFLMVFSFIELIIIFLLAFKPHPKADVFTVDERGRFTQIKPLSEDSLTQKQLITWTEDCVLELNSYTFYSAINHLNKVVPRCLTNKAGQEFINNFGLTILDDMRASEQSFEASLNGAGIITAEGVVEGRKAYQIQIPIIVTRYDMDKNPKNFEYVIKLEVIRVSEEEFTKGVKIYRYSEV